MKIMLNSDTSKAPERATEGSAGFDLFSAHTYVIPKGGRELVKTGVAVEIPRGHVGFICSRSGIALKNGVFVLNAPGVIDRDYRGELGVILANMGTEPFYVKPGDRIAQLVICSATTEILNVVESLDTTARGAGGFGSTGQ